MTQVLTAETVRNTVALETATKQRWNLGRTSRAIIASLASTVLPREGRDRATINYVVRFVDDFVPFMPALMRLGFPLGLLLLQWGTFVTMVAAKPFTLVSERVRERYLHRWAESPFALFRALAQGVRGLILSAYYEQPKVYEALGYDPKAYLEECRTRRAALVAAEGEADHHTRSMLFEDIGRGGR